jgi:hypothetical protein
MSHVNAPRRGAILFLPGLLLFLSSCSGTEDSGSQTAASSTAPTISPTTQPEQARFTQRDVPANGVARQVAFYFGAGGTSPECTFQHPLPSNGAPYIAMPSTRAKNTANPVQQDATLAVFEAAEVCLVGFVPNGPVTITATAPNGDVKRKSVVDKESAISGSYSYTSGYYVSPRPDDPVGTYRIVAVQGPRKAAMTVTVVPARKPTLLGVPREELSLSGFTSGQRLAMNFYGGSSTDFSSYPTDPKASYARLLPYLGTMEVRLDGNGQGVYPWPEELDKGCFGVDAAGLRKYGQVMLCTAP